MVACGGQAPLPLHAIEAAPAADVVWNEATIDILTTQNLLPVDFMASSTKAPWLDGGSVHIGTVLAKYILGRVLEDLPF